MQDAAGGDSVWVEALPCVRGSRVALENSSDRKVMKRPLRSWPPLAGQ